VTGAGFPTGTGFALGDFQCAGTDEGDEMKRMTVFHNKECARCRRIARVHRFFDWFNRVETSTDIPATGPLVPGEIAVLDHKTGQTLQGVEAVRLIYRNVPAYIPLLPFLRFPAIARWIDREVRGCQDGSCTVPRIANEVRS
jgi:hypothetical protein